MEQNIGNVNLLLGLKVFLPIGKKWKCYQRNIEKKMSRQGSAGNTIAALASFFAPGLGQLVQGRAGAAIVHFLLAFILWLFALGWIVHITSCLNAAKWKPVVK